MYDYTILKPDHYNTIITMIITMLPTIIFGKNTAGAHKEPSKKYKSNLTEEQKLRAMPN